MTGDRGELPEGWMMHERKRLCYAGSLDGRALTNGFRSEAEAIAAAWRVVDAEREADDGR